jgi:hypothetical protein
MLGDIPHQWTDGREEWRGEGRSGAQEVSHIPFPIVLDDVGALARLIHLNISTLGIPEPVPRPIKNNDDNAPCGMNQMFSCTQRTS